MGVFSSLSNRRLHQLFCADFFAGLFFFPPFACTFLHKFSIIYFKSVFVEYNPILCNSYGKMKPTMIGSSNQCQKGFIFFGAVEEGPFQMPRNVASVRKKTLLRVRRKMYNNTEGFCSLQ